MSPATSSCRRNMIIPVVTVTLFVLRVECASLPQINSTDVPSIPPAEVNVNSTEGRNSLIRKPWTPNLFGQNSLASILDPLNPLGTFSRLPQLAPIQNTLGPLVSPSAPVYSQPFDLTTDYSSTLANSPFKGVTSSPSASSTIDPNEPSPGAMSLLYVFSEASKRIPIAELPKRVESMGDSINNWAGDAMKGIEAQAVSFGDTFVEYLQSAAGEAVKRTGQLLSSSLDSLERTVKSYLSDWIGCGPPKG